MDDQMSEEERRALLLEHRTWQLIRAVYECASLFYQSADGIKAEG